MTRLDELDLALSAALRAGNLAEFNRLGDIADAQQADRDARLTAPGALGNAAHWYTEQGIGVFLIVPRDKKPLLPAAHPPGSPERATCHGECGRLGHGLYDATTDVTVVRRWWEQHPQANIGTPTGRQFDVIDVDGPIGYQSMADLREAGLLPPVLGKVATPGWPVAGRPRGMHLYVAPTGDGNSAGFRPGLDYRGIGGYVLAPPSVGPDGNHYDWLKPFTVAAS